MPVWCPTGCSCDTTTALTGLSLPSQRSFLLQHHPVPDYDPLLCQHSPCCCWEREFDPPGPFKNVLSGFSIFPGSVENGTIWWCWCETGKCFSLPECPCAPSSDSSLHGIPRNDKSPTGTHRSTQISSSLFFLLNCTQGNAQSTGKNPIIPFLDPHPAWADPPQGLVPVPTPCLGE